MVVIRNQILTAPLLSTYGTLTLLSRDGGEVMVPLAPLLGASSLLRSIVDESHLHPGVHGPLVLSITVAANVLESVRDIVGTGESNVMEENIEEVMQVLISLGVEANLSKSGMSNEYYEYAATNEEDIKLEIVLEPASDDEISNEGDVNEAMDNSLKVSSVNTEKLAVHDPNQSCRNNTVVKPYKCTICSYSCTRPNHLKTHNRIHTGERPFTCKICNLSFARRSNFSSHGRIHTVGEKPLKCKTCSFSCFTSSRLKIHTRIHTGEKPYKCKICSYSSTQSYNLKIHSRIHTGEKPHTCKICSHSFTNPGDLRTHSKIHTGEKPFVCQICSYYILVRDSVIFADIERFTLGGRIMACEIQLICKKVYGNFVKYL